MMRDTDDLYVLTCYQTTKFPITFVIHPPVRRIKINTRTLDILDHLPTTTVSSHSGAFLFIL